MTDLVDIYDDDESIVKVTPSLCDDGIENTFSFVLPQKFITPGMSESQQLTDASQKQIQDMLKENNALRDALQKNNTDMRQLLASFRDFQDKTLQSRNIHKQKIESIWKENQKLQLDKENLSGERQELTNKLGESHKELMKVQEMLGLSHKKCSDYENQMTQLKEELKRSELSVLTATSLTKELEAEVALLKLDQEKMSNQNEALVQQLERQSEVFKEKLEAANLRAECSENALVLLKEDQDKQQTQLLKLNGELEKLSSDNQTLLEKLDADFAAGLNGSPDEEVMGFAVVNKQTLSTMSEFNLQKRLEETELRCAKLNKTIAEQKEQLDNLEEEQKKWKMSQDVQIAEHFFQTTTPVNFTNELFQQYEERYQSLGEQLGACQERLQYLKLEESSSSLQEGLKHEIQVLKELLEQERQDKVNEKRVLEERIQQLSKEYNQILDTWKIYENEQTTKGRQNEALSMIEKRQHQEKLDELIARNVMLEEESQEKDIELTNYKGQISMLTRETEHVPILRAQVEVYRQDFARERDEKAKAEAMIGMLKQDVTSLQSQLTELRDQQNVFHEQQVRELTYHQEQQRREQNLGHELPRAEASRSSMQDDGDEPISLTLPQPIEEIVLPRSKKVIIQSPRHSDRDQESRRRSHHHRRSNSPQPESLVQRNTYECPRCKMSYSTVTAVENHLEGCLREDSPYP